MTTGPDGTAPDPQSPWARPEALSDPAALADPAAPYPQGAYPQPPAYAPPLYAGPPAAEPPPPGVPPQYAQPQYAQPPYAQPYGGYAGYPGQAQGYGPVQPPPLALPGKSHTALFVVLGVAGLALVLLVCGSFAAIGLRASHRTSGAASGPTPYPSFSMPAMPDLPGHTRPPATGKVGQPVMYDGLQFTVTAAPTCTTAAIGRAGEKKVSPKNGKFCMVNLAVVNRGSATRFWLISNVTTWTTENTDFHTLVDTDGTFAYTDVVEHSSLKPNVKVVTTAVFDLAATDKIEAVEIGDLLSEVKPVVVAV